MWPSELSAFPFQAGAGTLIMAAGVQDFSRTESDRLNEIKGHLEIALLEKHFLREYKRVLMGDGPLLNEGRTGSAMVWPRDRRGWVRHVRT